MKIKRIEHVAIAVGDMDAFKRMLEGTFGLSMEYEQTSDRSTLAMYPVAQTYIEVIQGKSVSAGTGRWAAEKGPGMHHLCFEVEDLKGALAELRANHVGLLDEQPRPGHGGAMIAFVDPRFTGGVLIELVQSGTSGAH